MSRISIKLSELGDTEFFGNLVNFVDKIRGCGNDVLEIEHDVIVPYQIVDFINDLHLTDGNKRVKIVYTKP